MFDPRDVIDLNSCRICLSSKKPLSPLFKYKLSGNYAEMLTAVADVKVSANDGLPEKICQKCCTALEKAFLLKTVAERTDKKLHKIISRSLSNVPTKKIAFDSFTDIKSEIGPLTIKSEPKWEMEIDMLADYTKPVDTVDGKDIVIANTVIRKVDGSEDVKPKVSNEEVDLTWKSSSATSDAAEEVEYLEDDFFHDDDNDADYVPSYQDDDDEEYVPKEKKTKFKKPKLSEIKVFKGKKTVVRKVKVLKKPKVEIETTLSQTDGNGKTTMITCYPIMKNGSRGPPILLKRPKDATVLKVHPNYKVKSSNQPKTDKVKVVNEPMKRDKPMRYVRSAKPMVKQREKLVCPICGILTYTLGNHISTHQEKKKFSCSQCTKTFSQKGNLLAHIKQHSGVKDHICEICGAGFYSQKSLVRHNLIHKNDRPYACTLCTKRFIAAQALQVHMRVHSGDRPFKCEHCDKRFVQQNHLRSHLLIHTKAKPYSCEVCNVAFSYKVNLNNHVSKVHGVNLKFKSIHTVTEEVLRREMGISESRLAVSQILPPLARAPAPAAHATIGDEY